MTDGRYMHLPPANPPASPTPFLLGLIVGVVLGVNLAWIFWKLLGAD